MAFTGKIIKYPETSVIIRTKNEEKWLAAVLAKLAEQSYKNFEIIIVDSGSDDFTLSIARDFKVRIFTIPADKFSYPHASNYGCQRAKASKYLVFLSGHSIPISNTWLADGIEDFAKFPKICGVYGPTKSLPKSTTWDKIFSSGPYHLGKLVDRRRHHLVNKSWMGVMGFTNAIILKKFWDQKHFNEKFGLGGEDGEWAGYWFSKGYRAVLDYRFAVMHSHGLGLGGWIKQYRYWYSLRKPLSFKPLAFRKSRTHS